MNFVFIGVIILLIISAFHGYKEGFIRTVFRMFSLIAALIAGIILGKSPMGKIMIFFAARLLLWYLSTAFNIISKLPILKGLNRLGGFLAGLFQGFILLWILCLVLNLFIKTTTGQLIYDQIESSFILKSIYVLFQQ